MAKAYKCDICHKLFEHITKPFNDLGIKYYDKVVFASSRDIYDNTIVNMDVCPDCMIKLMKDANLYKPDNKENEEDEIRYQTSSN